MEIDDGVWIRFKADMSDIQAKLGALPAVIQGAASGLANAFNLEKLSIGAISLGSTLTTAISGPLTAIKEQSLGAFAGFEASMARVQAMTGETKSSIQSLNDLAMQLGSTTQFSATKIAVAMGDLASAGLKVSDIYKAMPGVLDFAAAGQMKLADAAKVATTVMHQYGMQAADMGKIADVIAHAASKSSAEVSDMGVAFNYFGTIAKQAHISLAQTAAAFEILADAGTRGSKAGTAMRQMIASLENPSKEAEKALKSLGISVRDAEKNLLPLDQIIGRLKPLLHDTGAGFEIFGKRFTEVVGLIEAGPEKFRALTRAAEETAGASRAMATTLMQGYQGTLKRFNDELDSMHVKIGAALAPASEAMIKNFGEPMVKMVGHLADSFRELPAPVQQAGLALSTVAQWAGPAITALGSLALAWPLISSGAIAVAGAMAGLAPLVIAAGAAFATWKLGEWLVQTDLVQSALASLKDKARDFGSFMDRIFGEATTKGGDGRMAMQIQSWKMFQEEAGKTANYVASASDVMATVSKKTGDLMRDQAKAALDAGNAQSAAIKKQTVAVVQHTEITKEAARELANAYKMVHDQLGSIGLAASKAMGLSADSMRDFVKQIGGAWKEVVSAMAGIPKSVEGAFASMAKGGNLDSILLHINSEAEKIAGVFGNRIPEAIRKGMMIDLADARNKVMALKDAVSADLVRQFDALAESIRKAGVYTEQFGRSGIDYLTRLGVLGGQVGDGFFELSESLRKSGEYTAETGKEGLKYLTELGVMGQKASVEATKLSRLWDSAITGLSRGLSDIILKGESVSKVFLKLGRDIVAAFVDQAIHSAIKSLIGGLFSAEGAVGSLSKAFSGLSGTISTALGGGSSAAGSAAGGIQGAVGGITGALGAIGSIGGMISGIIGNFQNARQETTLNAIEESTRYVKSYLRDNIVPDEQKYWPNLDKLAQLLRLEGIENGITKLAEGSGGSLANQLGRVIVPPLNELGNDIVGLGQALSIALSSFMADFTSGIYSQLEVLIQETRAFRTQAIPFLQAMAQSTIALYNTMAKPGNGVNYFQVVGQSANGGGGGGNTFNVNVNGNSTDAYRVGQMVVQGINSQLGVRV